MNNIVAVFAQNQEFVVSMISLFIVWLIGRLWKKSADKTQIAAALTMILDIVQDIANGDDVSNAEKKAQAVALVNQALPKKKKKLIVKVFGTVGGAIEYVWKNRKTFTQVLSKIKRIF